MGPGTFLATYAVVIIGGIVVGRWLTRQEATGRGYSVPPDGDPIAVAWLGGGDPGALRVAAVELARGGYVVPKGELLMLGNGAGQLSPVAKTLLDHLAAGTAARALFSLPDKHHDLRRALAGVADAWGECGMAWTASARANASAAAWLVAGLILAVGGWRVVSSLMAGYHNVFFTILLGVVGLILAATTLPLGRLTGRGEAHLRGLKAGGSRQAGAGSTTRPSPAPPRRPAPAAQPALAPGVQTASAQPAFAGPDLMSVALYGMMMTNGTGLSGFNTVFPQATTTSATGSSCGSNCGSTDSSSDSGSSGGDSGGSSCGSGCGGGGGD